MDSRSNRDIERPIALALLAGMLLSVALMLVGVGLLIAHPGASGPRVLPIGRAVAVAAVMRPDGWISLGVYALILTPVARVLMALGSFAWLRDWKYAAISSVVLTAMAAAFVLGK